jgi:hypothetical protein
MRYPGGKNSGGVYHAIINQIPPHRVYVEPFAGSAAILRLKRPAAKSFAIDIDPGAVGRLAGAVPEGTDLLCCDGIDWLEAWSPPEGSFVYCDPPYLNTLTPQRYTHRMGPAAHRRLLGVIGRLPCQVLISGYASGLYDELLADWRRIEFSTWTRGGPAAEVLWANYPEPEQLHDYRFLGSDHRERLDIRRQQQRWRSRVARMGRLKRLALMSVLADLAPGGDGISTVCRRGPPRHNCQRRRPVMYSSRSA